MPTGYVIALLLEAAGLIGFVLAARAMRAERRARAADLRGFLRSGQPVAAGTAAVARGRIGTGRAVDLPVVPDRSGAVRDGASSARAALGRALAAPGAMKRGMAAPGMAAPGMAAPLSAG